MQPCIPKVVTATYPQLQNNLADGCHVRCVETVYMPNAYHLQRLPLQP